MQILLIDDNHDNTQMLSTYMKIKGHDCTVSNDGRNGVTLMLEKKFDAVILDLAMPEYTGFDVIDKLEKAGRLKDQKRILLTASSVKENDIESLLKKGVHSCLRKPVKLEVLLKTMVDGIESSIKKV